MELCRNRAVCCQVIGADSMPLQYVAWIYDIAKFFDQINLVFEYFEIKGHYIDEQRSSEVVTRVALTSLFDLCPLLVLSAEKSFVR